jgi:hypothetical protein
MRKRNSLFKSNKPIQTKIQHHKIKAINVRLLRKHKLYHKIINNNYKKTSFRSRQTFFQIK